MKQREVTDQEGTTWTCVQAYSGASGKTAKQAEQITEENGQNVAVVCTPSGGAQSVRLQLSGDWLDEVKLPDDQLAKSINTAQLKG